MLRKRRKPRSRKKPSKILPRVKDVNFNCEKNLAEFSIAFLPLRIIKAYPESTLRDLSEISRGEGGGNRGRVTTF